MKCGLYDESYKIAADTNLLVNYLYNCHLKVAYLPEFVTRMRMGGMSTDSAKRKKVWDEDIRVYSGYGFKPVTLTKLMKMAWKVPQFIQAKFSKTYPSFLTLKEGSTSHLGLLQWSLHPLRFPR